MNWRVKPYDLTAAYCALAGRMIEQQLRMAKVVLDHTWRSHLAFAGLAPATRPRTVTPPRRSAEVSELRPGTAKPHRAPSAPPQMPDRLPRTGAEA